MKPSQYEYLRLIAESLIDEAANTGKRFEIWCTLSLPEREELNQAIELIFGEWL